MNRVKLASTMAKREGKKSQARIGDIRELIKILEEIASEEMIANMDGISDTLEMLAARAREKATKRLNKIAPTSLTKDWKGKKRG
jgi:hypothetical protein